MGMHDNDVFTKRSVTRRGVIRGGAAAAGAAALGGFGAARGAVSAPGSSGSGAWSRYQDESIIFLSSQLSPIAEAEAMRNVILADFEREVDFIPEDPGPFNDRVQAEAQAGEGTVSLLGGLHGDFSLFVEQGLLTDISDLADELEDRGLIPDFLELGRFGTDSLYYIPWMQATYIMAARREALDYLPDGVDEDALQTSLTYEQLSEWAANINEAEGQRFGLPASDDGLLHRFFQGYAYPSFTGGVNTTFRSDAAVEMWEWLIGIWEYTNPQALTYGTMSEPLLSGEVWVAWDHTARLIDALRQLPDDFVTFPAPRGPEGLGFMPVVAGLAIPNTAPDVEGARDLIEYLTRPEVQSLTLQEVAFFPAIEAELPEELEPGIQAEADAVAATTADPAAIPSVLPIGLGEHNEAYNTTFRNAFRSIVIDGNDIQEVLDAEGENLQEILDLAESECWAPDPPSEGVCQVG